MKSRLLTLAVSLQILSLASCDPNELQVPQVFIQELSRLYPQANRVEWKLENGYYIAEFSDDEVNSDDVEAWFSPDGNWAFTVSELNFNQLPSAVQTAFQGGEYATYQVDDVEKIERQGFETLYELEVEKADLEYTLSYTETGILAQVGPSDDNDEDHSDLIPSTLPAAITEYLSQNYPNASTTDADKEATGYEVDILDGTTERDLYFSLEGAWLRTVTEIATTTIPQAAITAIQTKYPGSTIENEADAVETPDGDYFLIEVEPTTGNDIEVKVTADGTIL